MRRGHDGRATSRPSSVALLVAALLPTACVTISAPADPRPARPLPPEVAARYALPGEVHEDYLVPLSADGRIARGRLTCGEEHPEFHLMRPAGGGPAPFVLCLPILAGGRELMWLVADDLAERGFAVAFGRRVESALKPHQDVDAVETLFRRSIVHNRAILAWARRQAFIRPEQTGLLGISTGGILAGTMLALEPQVSAGVLILAGGDLPDLLQRSTESRIVRWRAARRAADGLSREELSRQLEIKLESDPARTAAYIPTEKVMMVTASLDHVVPPRNQDILWEALGRPTRLKLLGASHYSSILDVLLPTGATLPGAAQFLRRRMAEGAGPVPAGQ